MSTLSFAQASSSNDHQALTATLFLLVVLISFAFIKLFKVDLASARGER